MPATYTYNNAIDDAKSSIFAVIDEVVAPLNEQDAEPFIALLLTMTGRLERLKRRERARPAAMTDGGEK